MTTEEIHKLVNRQHEYFATGATLPVDYRIDALCRLKASILKHESEIAEALRQDLGKSNSESYMCEIGMVLSELSFLI